MTPRMKANGKVSCHPSGVKATAAYHDYTCVDDKPCGYGIKTYRSKGDRYEGYHVDGKREGWGMYQFANGDKYTGQRIFKAQKNCK